LSARGRPSFGIDGEKKTNDMLETTIAGSLPKPEWLAETEKLWPAWRLEGEDLKRGQERSAAEWLKHQAEAPIGAEILGYRVTAGICPTIVPSVFGLSISKSQTSGA
jgi:hypothetical protein